MAFFAINLAKAKKLFKLKIMHDIQVDLAYIAAMNKLNKNKRVQVLSMLVEGCSMRSISRVVGVSINTVTKLLVDAGKACNKYHDITVKNVKSKTVQVDEIWSFCNAKQKNVAKAKLAPNGAGDIWTWSAIDADSKLIISYCVGGRESEYALEFIKDVAQRLASRIQLTSDGHKAYLNDVDYVFGDDIDYAQLIKLYGNAPETLKGRYSPSECVGTKKNVVTGSPNNDKISTSYAERQNLTMRMSMRRFTRLTNTFSEKIENHIHMLSLYFVFYNFCRIHKTLGVTPAMEAGISNELKDIEWICDLIDENTPKLQKRGPYKKRNK